MKSNKILFYVVSSLDFVSNNLVPFFYRRNKNPTVFCCFSPERPNKLPAATLQYYLFNLSQGNWIFESLRKYSPTKSNAFFVLPIVICFFKKISIVHRKRTVFQVVFKTNSYFCWLYFLHSVWLRKPKKWQQPVPDHFDGSEDFFSELFFLDSGLKSQQGIIQLLLEKFNYEGFTFDFKGSKWLLWSRCLELDKRKCPEVWKNPPGRKP